MQNVQTASARTQRTLGQPTVCPPLCLRLSHSANLLQPPWCIFHFAARSAVIWIKYASAVLQLGAGVALGSLWVLQLQLELWPAWVIKVNYIFHGAYQFFLCHPLTHFSFLCLLHFMNIIIIFYLCHVLGLSLPLSLWWFFHSINLRVDLFAGDRGKLLFSLLLLLLFIWKSVQTRCGIIPTCCV